MALYPKANQTVKGSGSGPYTSGPFKGVLHTTEGPTGSGAIAAFKSHNSWPHFLVDYVGTVWQFIDTSQGARALQNLPGGVQTNLDSAIQIEIVGFAAKPKEHPTAQVEALKELMRWIESTMGVKPVGPGRAFASAYGQNFLRFAPQQWDNFNGWCGHCHVPENDHWDPGAIDINVYLPAPGFNVPATYFSEAIQVPFAMSRTQGGYSIVGGDGGVFSYDTPFYGSLGGVILSAPIVVGTWTPTGAGYWLIGADGAVYSFGDAAFHGGLNGSDALGNRKIVGVVAKGNGYRIVALDPSGDGSPFDPYDFGV